MKFEDPQFSKESISDITSSELSKACNAILSICLYSGNYDLAIASVRKSLTHKNEDVVGCAIISIGHIARLWGKIPNDLLQEVERAEKHESISVRGQAISAINDIKFFIKGS